MLHPLRHAGEDFLCAPRIRLPVHFAAGILEETERMCTMGKRYTVIFLTFLLVLLPMETHALGEGSIQIDLLGGGEPIQGAEIRVYLAGAVIENGYRLTDAFGGGMITQLDVFSPELAVWLSQRATGGQAEITDEYGSVIFWDLDEGLYLVTQPKACGGYTSFEPFLITIPWDGYEWSITAVPKTERQIDVVPDTSDPEVLARNIPGILMSAMGLASLALFRKRWR